MSPALLEAPPGLFASEGVGPRSGRPAEGRGLTLEERLRTVLRSAQLEGVSECPVCRAAMRAEGAAARCGGCGSVVA